MLRLELQSQFRRAVAAMAEGKVAVGTISHPAQRVLGTARAVAKSPSPRASQNRLEQSARCGGPRELLPRERHPNLFRPG